MKWLSLLLLLLVTNTVDAQIRVADVGDGWKDKVDSAMRVIQVYDSAKYNLLIEHCTKVDYWLGKFATTEDGTTIIIPSIEMKVGYINDIAAILVHESLHLFFLHKKINISASDEERDCYLYELDFLLHVPNVEPWLIKHAELQIINYTKP